MAPFDINGLLITTSSLSTAGLGGIVTDSLVLHLDAGYKHSYPMGGTTWYDLDESNNGTLTNGPTFSSVNRGLFTFDGSNDYVNFGNILNFTTENFSFDMFVRFSSIASNKNLFYKGGFNANGYYFILSSGLPNFVTNQAGAAQGTQLNQNLTTSVWYHIVAVRNGSSVKLYLNGVDSTGTAATHINPASSTDNFLLGIYSPSLLFPHAGDIARFLAYNKALSAAEVLQNFNAIKDRFGL
jgi:hypothetical protein